MKTVTILIPKVDADTRPIIPKKVRVVDSDTGEELVYLDMRINICPNSVLTASLTVYVAGIKYAE